MTPYIFQRGETITLALDAMTGDPASVTSLVAQLKALPPGRSSVDASVPIAASFAVSPRAATGDNLAGWTLSIDASASAALAPGNYLADARLGVAGGVVITETVALRIREAVSA